MTLVVSGPLNKQVGGELGINEITVRAHCGKMMQKMKADSLPARVKWATQNFELRYLLKTEKPVLEQTISHSYSANTLQTARFARN